MAYRDLREFIAEGRLDAVPSFFEVILNGYDQPTAQ